MDGASFCGPPPTMMGGGPLTGGGLTQLKSGV